MRLVNRPTVALLPLALLSLPSGCSMADDEPKAENVEWSVQRTQDRKGYHLTGSASFVPGLGGWYQPTATLVDARGCRNVIDLEETQVVDTSIEGNIAAKFDKLLEVPRPVATAEFRITYEEAPPGSLDVNSITKLNVFSEERVIDPTVRPPEYPQNACGKSKAELRSERADRLRERAKTDPEGADAEAIDNMSRNEVMATAINSAGYLCARVTDMYPSGGAIIVSCVEYRSGSSRVKYRVDANAGSVEEIS